MTSLRIMTKEFATWFFAEFYRGEHHFPSQLEEWGTGWAVVTHGDLATWDFNGLTRLVVMGHQEFVRVSITPSSPGHFRIAIHPRSRGNGANDHPELGSHIERITKDRQSWHERHPRPNPIQS